MALEITGALERGELGVHARGGLEPDGLADLPHARRIALGVERLPDHVEDPPLALVQLLLLRGVGLGGDAAGLAGLVHRRPP
jgi:hypothetical protein